MTVPAPAQLQNGVPPPAARRPRRGGRIVALVCGLGLLALAALGVWIYVAFLRYAPTAHRHVPSNAVVAIRADAAEIVLFKPVRKHLWPLLEGRSGAKTTRLDRLAQKTGIHIPRDLREVVVAAIDVRSWVLLAGGKFPPGKLVRGLDQVLREEGTTSWALDGELLVHPLGLAVGQAADGTLVLGTTRDGTLAALPASKGSGRAPLPVEGGLSFVATEQAWSGIVALVPSSVPGLDLLTRIQETSGSFSLSDSPKLRLTLAPKKGEEAADLAKDVDRAITTARRLAILVPGDLGGAKDAMREAEVRDEGGKVLIDAPWPYEAIDAAVARLAELLGGAESGATP